MTVESAVRVVVLHGGRIASRPSGYENVDAWNCPKAMTFTAEPDAADAGSASADALLELEAEPPDPLLPHADTTKSTPTARTPAPLSRMRRWTAPLARPARTR